GGEPRERAGQRAAGGAARVRKQRLAGGRGRAPPLVDRLLERADPRGGGRRPLGGEREDGVRREPGRPQPDPRPRGPATGQRQQVIAAAAPAPLRVGPVAHGQSAPPRTQRATSAVTSAASTSASSSRAAASSAVVKSPVQRSNTGRAPSPSVCTRWPWSSEGT